MIFCLYTLNPASLRTTISPVLPFQGMFSKGLMDGSGLFIHADGLKYEVCTIFQCYSCLAGCSDVMLYLMCSTLTFKHASCAI